jgi:filamentous hemagglutinin family protein
LLLNQKRRPGEGKTIFIHKLFLSTILLVTIPTGMFTAEQVHSEVNKECDSAMIPRTLPATAIARRAVAESEGLASPTPIAQAIPDGSIPTTVQQFGDVMKINGGETVGNNLFHSFEDFSIPEGMEAAFQNAANIENIFARITGDSASLIDGVLSTQGGANLFLINPHGINFGQNALLEVGGSFIGTTAESVEFEGGTIYSATVSDSEPLLTSNIPIGLGFGSYSGVIKVDGAGNQITSESPFQPIEFKQKPEGLSVPAGETLALIGNGVNLNGGVVTTNGGEIYLTSVDSGLVSINQNQTGFTFAGNDSTKYQDINLTQQSLIDASGEQAGIISLVGKNINLLDASFVLVQNESTSSEGSINFNAVETLSLSGRGNNISSNIRSETLSTGKGADINISANQLKVQDQGQIQAASFGKSVDSEGGNINVNVSDAVDLNSGLISASAFSEGNAGNIELSTSRLQVTNISSVTSSTVGTGNGGNIIINTDFIKLIGSTSNSRSTISASSLGGGNAGNLTINTQQLQVEEGASFSSSSFGNGNAGDISIDASKLITLNGNNSNFQSSTEPQGSTIRTSVQSVSPIGQKIFGLPEVPTGDAGNLTINTPQLNVLQEGIVSVENQGTGLGGTLSIDAAKINLIEGGKITAASASGQGGNIAINTEDLQLATKSQISANAGGSGNGGNITIDARSVVGSENSDITANAFRGNGGNVTINTDYIFGIEEREKLTPYNDITADSELGIDGTVTINAPESNADEDVIANAREERRNLFDDLYAGSCLNPKNRQRSELTITGMAQPETPYNFFAEKEALELPPEAIQPEKTESNIPPTWEKGDPVVEANAVQINPDGRKFLIVKEQVESAESQICNQNPEERNKN